MVQGWQASSHQWPWTQTVTYPISSWPASVQTPRNQLNYTATGKVLLVAGTSEGSCGLRSRVCRMPKTWSQQPTYSSGVKPHLPHAGGTPIQNNCTGFYHKAPRVTGFRLHPHYHRPQLHRNVAFYPLPREDQRRRNCSLTVCVKTVQVFGGFVLIPVYLRM